MKARTKQIALVLGGITALGVGGVTWLGSAVLSPDSTRNRSSAVDCILTWGRLAQFPTSARQVAISTEGGMFTRAFRASFVAPPADIERWLQQSPGTREVSPTAPSPGLRHFAIAPGGGAQHAEVTVDLTGNRVLVYVYWS